MKLVLRLPVPSTPRSRYYAVSGVLHAAGAILLFLSPLLVAGPRISQDAPLVVDVVGSLPGARPPAPKVEPPAPRPPEPSPEGVRAEPELPPEPKVVPKPEKKQPEKMKEPEPEPKPSPVVSPPSPAQPPEQAPPIDGGVGAAGGAGVESVELAAVENAWYLASVDAALQTSWARPILEGSRETHAVTVAFDILRDGGVSNPRVIASSGMPALDRSALRAVVDASPFPPHPDVWRKPFVTAVFVFKLEPGER